MAADDNNDDNVAILMSMGFDRTQSIHALNECQNLEMAINSLLSGDGGDNDQRQHQGASSLSNQISNNNDDVRAVHSDVSQYSESLGRSACTAIALTMASKFLKMMAINNNTPASIITTTFLSDSIQEGIQIYSTLSSSSNDATGVEHSSVEELIRACSRESNGSSAREVIISTIQQFDFSPRQGILSNISDNRMGLEAVLSQCQADAIDSQAYIAVVITKPPESVLVVLPPSTSSASGSNSSYILLDSHPRPQQLIPHCPSGSYALFHPTLSSLVSSIKQIFPVTELGNDIPEMMAMMYNSFDAYPFQCRR